MNLNDAFCACNLLGPDLKTQWANNNCPFGSGVEDSVRKGSCLLLDLLLPPRLAAFNDQNALAIF